LYKALRFVVMTAAFIALLFVVAGYAAPLHPFFDSVSVFRVHAAVGLTIACVLLLSFKFWKTAFAGFLFATFAVLPIFGLFSSESHTGAATTLRVVQFNVYFRNADPQGSTQWLAAQNADVITFQEVAAQSKAILDGLAIDFPFQIVCEFSGVGSVAVISRFPFTDQKCIPRQGLTWARVAFAGREFTVASLHLHWPYPFGQWGHVARLEQELRLMKRPVIIGGDFNTAWWSHAAGRIADATETRAIRGFRLTLRKRYGFIPPIPLLPIDHVFVPSHVRVKYITVGPPIGSDHLPVVADLVF
jgi:endonuclease/exonuclease/phosphatase (EEP) superfamily protein YafD